MHDSMHAQPPTPSFSGTTHRRMMMHMTFYWGDSAEILFSGWPGRDDPVMYGVSLTFVFVLAVLVDWLSHCRFRKPGAKDVLGCCGLVYTRCGLGCRTCWCSPSCRLTGVFFWQRLGGTCWGSWFLGAELFRNPAGLVLKNCRISLPVLADKFNSCGFWIFLALWLYHFTFARSS